MKAAFVALTSAALLVLAAQAQAGNSSDTSGTSPGQQMKSENGPGASNYALPSGDNDLTPGQQMKEKDGPGASNYAPGNDKGAELNAGKRDSHPTSK